MKKYLIIFALFVSMTVNGQFNTGSVYFTGMTGANLGYELQEGTSYIPYNLNLEGGYFLMNRLSVGGAIRTHGSFVFGPSTGSHELYLGPAVRYYLERVEGIQIYVIGNPFYRISNSYNAFGFAAGAGLNYFITERIALEARASYRFQRDFYEGFGYNTHALGFDVGLSVFFPSINFFSN